MMSGFKNNDAELMVIGLLAARVIFVLPASDGGFELAVNCNDLFAPATTDAEPFLYHDLPEIDRAWREQGRSGVARWAILHRNARPTAFWADYLRLHGLWDASMDALEVQP